VPSARLVSAVAGIGGEIAIGDGIHNRQVIAIVDRRHPWIRNSVSDRTRWAKQPDLPLVIIEYDAGFVVVEDNKGIRLKYRSLW
jgi:hypothetical protein